VRPSLEDLFIEAITDKESGKVSGVGAARGRGKRAKGGR
jgi:hypothetical protein